MSLQGQLLFLATDINKTKLLELHVRGAAVDHDLFQAAKILKARVVCFAAVHKMACTKAIAVLAVLALAVVADAQTTQLINKLVPLTIRISVRLPIFAGSRCLPCNANKALQLAAAVTHQSCFQMTSHCSLQMLLTAMA